MAVLSDLPFPEVQPFIKEIQHVSWVNDCEVQTIQHFIDLLAVDFDEGQWRHIQIVILMLGVSDWLQCRNFDRLCLKYRALVNIIRARLGDISIICCTNPPRKGLIFEDGITVNRSIVSIAKELHVQNYPLHRPFVKGRGIRPDYFTSDFGIGKLGITVFVKLIKMFKARLYL